MEGEVQKAPHARQSAVCWIVLSELKVVDEALLYAAAP